MKFEDIKGNTKLHIGCKKEYLSDWINVNTNPDDIDVVCDATWNLTSIVYWQKESFDVIYAESFLYDLQVVDTQADIMLASYKHILKKDGYLVIGLDLPEYITKISPWLKKLGFKHVIFFDVSDVNDKKYLPVS